MAHAVDLEERLVELNGMLTLARAMYFSEDPDRDRIAARTALAGCIKLIVSAFGNGIDLVLPLRDLNYALHDLDEGRKGPMLKPAKRKGGRPIPIADEAFRAMIAAMVELYGEAGEDRDSAIELTASRLAQLGYVDDRGRAFKPGQVEDWYDKINEGGDSLGVRRFKRTLEEIRQICPDQPIKAIELVAESLSAIRRPGSSPAAKRSDSN